jgi:hypothetical protein
MCASSSTRLFDPNLYCGVNSLALRRSCGNRKNRRSLIPAPEPEAAGNRRILTPRRDTNRAKVPIDFNAAS